MRLRPHVVGALVRKDVARLLRNGPALMLMGLFVLVAFLASSSGFVEEERQDAPSSGARREASWIVYWQDGPWVELLKMRAPPELAIRFVDASDLESETYPPDVCVIELRPPMIDRGRKQVRRHVRYRYPGTDQAVLWPVTRWFLSVSIEHFGDMPQLFETIQPLTPPTSAEQRRAALERVSIADVLSLSLLGTALLTTILFFAGCGLLVSLTAQERERGALRALLLTPATYFEFVVAKAIVHGVLALSTSALVMAALQPAVLGSLLYWATMVALTGGYFAVGLLIASFARNQAAPNLLSFAYLLAIGALNLLGYRFEAFRFLSSLTFERHGLVLTLASLNNPDLTIAESLGALRSTSYRSLFLLSCGLLLIATFVGSRRMTRD
ncbi:MAG: ABC transporter permease subunit [Planctomycetota bacterium]